MTQDTRSIEPADGCAVSGSDVYERLALHLEVLSMGLPRNDVLLEVLKETLTPAEAEISLLLPTRVAPLQPVSVDEIAATTDMPREELAGALEDMACRRLLFAGATTSGERGYALLQSGFGFGEQRFLWGGDESEYAGKMVEMLGRYFSQGVEKEQSACPTKPYRYIPANESISSDLQAVFPYHTMEAVVRQARRFAVAHCPCRMAAKIKGEACEHPIEVCLKFDDLMATYFMRTTEQDACVGCGACAEICPVQAVTVMDGVAVVDEEWCIGCGVCVSRCPTDAIGIGLRDDIDRGPVSDFRALHEQMLQEKGLIP